MRKQNSHGWEADSSDLRGWTWSWLSCVNFFCPQPGRGWGLVLQESEVLACNHTTPRLPYGIKVFLHLFCFIHLNLSRSYCVPGPVLVTSVLDIGLGWGWGDRTGGGCWLSGRHEEDSCICQFPLLLRCPLATCIQPGPGQLCTLPGAGLSFLLTQTGLSDKLGGMVVTALLPPLLSLSCV